MREEDDVVAVMAASTAGADAADGGPAEDRKALLPSYKTREIRTLHPREIYPAKSIRLTSVPWKTTTRRSYRRFNHARAEAAETMATTEKLGIKITRNPPETKLAELGVRSWAKWGCPPSNFPWTYSSKETCYLLKGKVKVYPDKYDEAVEIGAGDLVVFPKGMSCTWDVSETVDKHYIFE